MGKFRQGFAEQILSVGLTICSKALTFGDWQAGVSRCTRGTSSSSGRSASPPL